MKIVYVTLDFPFPPNRGDKIRSHHLLRHLAGLAPVHVGCFSENVEDRAAVSDVAAISATHCVTPRSKPLVLAGAEAVLTPESCRNGTERTFAALEAADIQEEAIINFQGDALLTPPWVLEAMVEEFASADRFDIVTPAVRLDDDALAAFMEHKKDNPSSGTTVVFDGRKNALYFSKQVIPYLRKKDAASVHRHIGLYGYTREGLKTYVGLEEALLERTEGLEQLRALENGLVVRVTLVDYRGRTHASVDNKDDIGLAEKIIDREGELVGA